MGGSYHADSQKWTQSMTSLQSLLSQIKPAAFTDKWCAILKDTNSENSGLTLAIKIISRQLNSFQWYPRRQTLKLYFTSSKNCNLWPITGILWYYILYFQHFSWVSSNKFSRAWFILQPVLGFLHWSITFLCGLKPELCAQWAAIAIGWVN